MIQRVTAVPRPPDRADDAHKGDFGRVLVLAGSRGMAGAAALCGLGALRGGAGLVTVATPACCADAVTAVEPGLMTHPIPDGNTGCVPHPGLDRWLTDVLETPHDVIAVGCGLGRGNGITAAVKRIAGESEKPVVVDADGLNALGSPPGFLPTAAAPRVFTPHAGEFARLLGPNVTAKDVQADREDLAVRFAGDFGLVLLLKGHRTLVTDGDRLFTNRTGNPGMATGGAGDVLTGLLAALIGQGMPPFEAACCAAHLHGRAGDLAAAALSRPGLIASDLPRYIAKAFADPAFPE